MPVQTQRHKKGGTLAYTFIRQSLKSVETFILKPGQQTKRWQLLYNYLFSAEVHEVGLEHSTQSESVMASRCKHGFNVENKNESRKNHCRKDKH